jgi:hypothetical protein
VAQLASCSCRTCRWQVYWADEAGPRAKEWGVELNMGRSLGGGAGVLGACGLTGLTGLLQPPLDGIFSRRVLV